eukprot:s323_g27.t1
MSQWIKLQLHGRKRLSKQSPSQRLERCYPGTQSPLRHAVNDAVSGQLRHVIPYAEISLDSTDLTVDDHWLDRLACLASQARSASQSSKSALPDMLRLAGKPIVEEYVVPSCPRIVQIDALHISSIAVRVWCSIRLDSVRFLPGYVRSAIRLLSLSARFHLDGASVSLPRRRLPPYRGSVNDFLGCLTAEYTVNFLHNVGAVLGRSSVLKLPRVPLKLGGTAVSYVTDSIGLAAGEAAALLNKLTFDEDFVAKQREQQGTKRIRGLGDGVVEASKSIAQGVEGVMDVVKKPVQGARSSGLSGFLMGVGIGMAGSFVKPVSRVGQAISDVGSGLAAELAPDSGPTQRHRARTRKRQPRLFFSVPTSTTDLMDDAGPSHIRPFSDLEAATLHHLGSSRLCGLQEWDADASWAKTVCSRESGVLELPSRGCREAQGRDISCLPRL